MNRRDILKLGGVGGVCAVLSPSLLRASTPTVQRRLVIVLAQGGWDTTYSIDPKIQSDSVDVPAGTIQTFENLDVFTDPSRPGVAAYFTKYAAQTAIVRGISVASVAHAECVKRICTGTRNSTSPDMGSIVSHDLGNGLPLPYLILGDAAFTGEYAVSAGRVGTTNQILALLDPAQAYGTGSAAPFVTSDAEDMILATYANASADRARATRGALGYNRKRVDDFAEAIERSKLVQGARAAFGKRGATLAFSDQIALGLQALSQGLSQAVMLNTRLKWDTHTQNAMQNGEHDTTFADLVTLLDGLAARPGQKQGTTMLDDTVVVCCSEMGRSPLLNANKGKDHWPVTSALVMGAGVDGGRVFGGTTADMQAENVDFATGAVSDSGLPIMFQNFVAGVLALCGADPSAHLSGTEVFDAFVA